jgi:hypothetical protein
MKSKKLVVIPLFLMISVLFLPLVTSKNEQNDEFNLSAELEPFRKVFPRMYTLLVMAQFVYTYNCENGTYLGGDNLTFQVKRLADNKLIYSETIEMLPIGSSSGRGGILDYTCYSGINRFFSLYEAKITLNVDDSDPSDNEASCYFMVIEII